MAAPARQTRDAEGGGAWQNKIAHSSLMAARSNFSVGWLAPLAVIQEYRSIAFEQRRHMDSKWTYVHSWTAILTAGVSPFSMGSYGSSECGGM
jgi:hypothetical protein